MKIPHPHSLQDYLPRFSRSHTPKSALIDTGPATKSRASFTEELLTISFEEDPDARFTLADSLNILETCEDSASNEQITALKRVIAIDALDLAARVTPTAVADQLGIRAKRRDDTGFEQPPTLRDVFLLAYAYDATGDTALGSSLAYILDSTPPTFSNELAEAYERAAKHDTPIMSEYLSITVAIDDRLDKNGYLNVSNRQEDTAASPAPIKSAPGKISESTQPQSVIF